MVPIKTQEEIEIMAEGGKILAKIMADLEREVKPGITTKTLDGLAESLVLKYGGQCSFKGYHGFPACLCTSINEEIVHAVPSDRALKQGDIISLDFGLNYKGFHSDMATTLAVGKINSETQRLIEITQKALEIGIEKIKPGNKIGDISRAIQKYVEAQGFNVVRELCGHGIGKKLHEDPEILNSVSFDKETVDKVKYAGDGNMVLAEGLVLCLEPMVTIGDWRIKKTADGFGFRTKDNSLSAHFEHMIAVTKTGYRILTIP
ncbi:MAG: type I methionyl aminopeptidase [Candidatus Nealsonbacteria bacterium RBG_13_42_11]|uniref:Methionine aminopeptidase n=1 Tax=Candidatus Nealsonbacteria bacterium RBG_13_42_11 TaxID=1801663 RepID=A0A1G2DZ02_9BACT|nr:MAG: type I methionyl aminopeptidase [Candidatus Nealsonbacteria bacterium RBG_13_42_11]